MRKSPKRACEGSGTIRRRTVHRCLEQVPWVGRAQPKRVRVTPNREPTELPAVADRRSSALKSARAQPGGQRDVREVGSEPDRKASLVIFKSLLRGANLPDIRFHDLRHTCATLLLGRGVHPKLVLELLGHATIAMTLDTHSHYLPSVGDQAASAMGDALG